MRRELIQMIPGSIPLSCPKQDPISYKTTTSDYVRNRDMAKKHKISNWQYAVKQALFFGPEDMSEGPRQ